MPSSDVTVEVLYYEQKDVPTPITGDSINRTIMILSISLLLFITCIMYYRKVNKKSTVKQCELI